LLLGSRLSADDLRDLALIIEREKIPVVDISACFEVTFIPELAFNGNIWLEVIHFPRNLDKVGSAAFERCFRLKRLFIPAKTVEERAFGYCPKLECVILPNIVGELSPGLFKGCCSLSSLRIPETVTNIGSYAFSGCVGYKDVIIPDDVMQLGNFAFDRGGLEYFVSPKAIECIPQGCFFQADLKSITVPPACRNIEEVAFFNCKHLEAVDREIAQ
jgi:hypothetical protein